ncbi:MAG: PD-(D/E)XK nuclease domain-containing protein [Atopobiaceae bacterium]|nr:PD-(D/E)XK nuclease domain-containing protein [Atopobiaceae bacterium]
MEFSLVLRKACHPELIRMVRESDALLEATIAGDEQAVASAIARAHDSAAGPMWYNDEQSLRFAVKLAYLTGIDSFARIEELPSGHGRADLVFLPKKRSKLPALIVELKWNKDVDSVLTQIHERNYPAVLKDWEASLRLVGITYNSKTKEHSCVIESL